VIFLALLTVFEPDPFEWANIVFYPGLQPGHKAAWLIVKAMNVLVLIYMGMLSLLSCVTVARVAYWSSYTNRPEELLGVKLDLQCILSGGSVALVAGVIELHCLCSWSAELFEFEYQPLGRELVAANVIAGGLFYTLILVLLYGIPAFILNERVIGKAARTPGHLTEKAPDLGFVKGGAGHILKLIAPLLAGLLSGPVAKILDHF
jgi:hypothetical protein